MTDRPVAAAAAGVAAAGEVAAVTSTRTAAETAPNPFTSTWVRWVVCVDPIKGFFGFD